MLEVIEVKRVDGQAKEITFRFDHRLDMVFVPGSKFPRCIRKTDLRGERVNPGTFVPESWFRQACRQATAIFSEKRKRAVSTETTADPCEGCGYQDPQRLQADHCPVCDAKYPALEPR